MQEIVRDLWKKVWKKEVISYAFWGLTTTILNIILYGILCNIMEYWLANILAIIICKVYSYFTNKWFVFKKHCANLLMLIKELFMYLLTTGFSGLIDFFGVLLLVEWLDVNQQSAKYIVTVVVMIANYILRKRFVFIGTSRESIKR